MHGTGPLAGVRILDISERSTSTAIAGFILGQFGAEVIRVEPASGDPLRAIPSVRDVWFAGSKSVVVTDRELADGSWDRLLASADVVIDTAHPSTEKPSGLLHGLRPHQILVVLTAHPKLPADATSGPDSIPVYGELMEAELGYTDLMAGLYSNAWESDFGRPAYLAWPEATFGAAWQVQIATISALIERARTGRARTVTTSLTDGLAMMSLHQWMHSDTSPPRPPDLLANPPIGPARMVVSLLETKQGWIYIHTGPRGSFNRLMRVLGRDDLVADLSGPKGNHLLDQKVAEELHAQIKAVFKTKTADEWWPILNEAGLSSMVAWMPGRLLQHEQAAANAFVENTGDLQRIGRVVNFERTPIALGARTAEVGEHSAELFATAQPKPAPALKPEPQREGGRVGPLDGMLVLDFGSYIAGPMANRVLADLGARVVKVEEAVGEPFRGSPSGYATTHRGKQNISVNLKAPEGLQAIVELVGKADILSHNMRLGVMDRLGLGYDAVKAANPRLIYAHSSGYGNTGPWASMPAFEPLHSTAAGMLYRTGGPGNRPMMYLTHMDPGGALAGSIAMLAALYEREVSHKGQYLEVAQLASTMMAMSDAYFDGGELVESYAIDQGARGHAPTNAIYDTADGHVLLACRSEREWAAIPTAIGLFDAPWPSYAEARLMPAAESPVAQRLQAVFAHLTTAEVLAALSGAGVPAIAPRRANLPAQRTPEHEAMGLFVTAQTPNGPIHEVGHSIRFSGFSAHTRTHAPALGQHTRAILAELGRSPQEIERLVSSGVVTAPPDDQVPVAAE